MPSSIESGVKMLLRCASDARFPQLLLVRSLLLPKRGDELRESFVLSEAASVSQREKAIDDWFSFEETS